MSFPHVCLHLGAGIYVQVITYVTAVETSEAIEICLTLFEVRQNACCERWFLRLRNDPEWVRRQRAAVARRGTETRGQGLGCRRPGPHPAPPSCAHPARARGGAPRGSRGGGAVSLSLVERQISFHDRRWLWGHAGRGCLWEDFKAPQKDAFLVATRLRARPLAAR